MIVLKACFASIGPEGQLKGKDLQDKDCPYLAEVLDGVEIDGVKFKVSWDSNAPKIALIGGELSQEIRPNYIEKIFQSVPQIVFKDPEARFTANVLNKFLRKANKVLSREPCNRGKALPVNMILIKDVE